MDAQQKTARARLSKSKQGGFDELLNIPAIMLFAQSPLTLCLVVELFSSDKLTGTRSTSRSGLYELSAQLMIERMARKCDDQVLSELGLTAVDGTNGGQFWLFLEALAFLLHTNGSRNFEQEDVRELGADEYQLWRTVVPVLGLCSAPILCQLPATEVTMHEDTPVKNGSIRGTWRFTHVAIQEYVLRERIDRRASLSHPCLQLKLDSLYLFAGQVLLRSCIDEAIGRNVSVSACR